MSRGTSSIRGPRPANLIGALALTLFLAGPPLEGAIPRAHGMRVAVLPEGIRVMDGDTAEIRWSAADVETVRILGIDAPELYERKGWVPDRGGALDPRGAEARGFARGAFAVAGRIELMRSAGLDRYRRTLGYFFLDGRNYSVMAIEAHLARETITRFGDNGLPEQARAVLEAAKRAGASAPRRPPRPRTRWIPWH